METKTTYLNLSDKLDQEIYTAGFAEEVAIPIIGWSFVGAVVGAFAIGIFVLIDTVRSESRGGGTDIL